MSPHQSPRFRGDSFPTKGEAYIAVNIISEKISPLGSLSLVSVEMTQVCFAQFEMTQGCVFFIGCANSSLYYIMYARAAGARVHYIIYRLIGRAGRGFCLCRAGGVVFAQTEFYTAKNLPPVAITQRAAKQNYLFCFLIIPRHSCRSSR